MSNLNKTLSVAVLSGKGGVGKTNLALNMGYCLYRMGQKVMLMDCDLGLANLDVLLGMSPERNIQDLLRPGINTKDVVVAIEEGGFDFLPAASGVPELIDMDEDMQGVLFEKLIGIMGRYQFLIFDLGAGISKTVLSFAAMTQKRLVVLTPEPTSLTDSYALIKVLNTEHKVDDFSVIVNSAQSQAEAKQTFERLQMACDKFLGIKINFFGMVNYDRTLTEAVRKQVPLIKLAPKAKASRDIIAIAAKLHKFRMDNMAKIAERPIIKNFPVFETD